MTISQSLIDQLTKGLKGYNPTLYDVTGKIATAVQLIATFMLFVLFMLEIVDLNKKMLNDGGAMSLELLATVAIKYLVATVFVYCTKEIIDSILWFGIQATKHVNNKFGSPNITESIPAILSMKVSWWAKPIIFLFKALAWIAMLLADVVARILILLRMFQLYIIKAVAPVLVVFYMNDSTKDICIGFFKQVGAIVLQGVIITIIIGFIPTILANDAFSINLDANGYEGAGELMKGVLKAVLILVKYVAVIILLIGSQGMSKRLVGAS